MLLSSGRWLVKHTQHYSMCRNSVKERRSLYVLSISNHIELSPSYAIVFRSQHFGAYEITQWETCQTSGDECLLDWTNPLNSAAFTPPQQCLQGSVPNFYVSVAAFIDF